MHKIVYLPVARNDLIDIVSYISEQLKAPQSAQNLLTEMSTSIQKLAKFPYSCRVYHSPQPLDDEFRLLVVKNYLVFYVVTQDTVEIRRVIYAKRNLSSILERDKSPK